MSLLKVYLSNNCKNCMYVVPYIAKHCVINVREIRSCWLWNCIASFRKNWNFCKTYHRVRWAQSGIAFWSISEITFVNQATFKNNHIKTWTHRYRVPDSHMICLLWMRSSFMPNDSNFYCVSRYIQSWNSFQISKIQSEWAIFLLILLIWLKDGTWRFALGYLR